LLNAGHKAIDVGNFVNLNSKVLERCQKNTSQSL
jgi:hypothetical protein